MGEELYFEERHVRLVQKKRLFNLLMDTKVNYLEQKMVYPLLPKALRERYSLDDLVTRYVQNIEFDIMEKRLRKVIGLYLPSTDTCYVAADLSRVNQANTALHELTHRAVTQGKRQQQPRLHFDSDDEEDFCRDVEVLFDSVVFYGETRGMQKEIRYLQKAYARIVHSPPRRGFLSERVEFYKELLTGNRLLRG
ncbi:MAG: hypothetical protein AABX13_01130 [Nanoarchaeota archaeon]